MLKDGKLTKVLQLTYITSHLLSTTIYDSIKIKETKLYEIMTTPHWFSMISDSTCTLMVWIVGPNSVIATSLL